MAEQAKITSVEALETFRANLIVFMGKARRSVDEVNDEVRRMRLWIQHDQRMHWEREIRARTKRLGEAKAELMAVKISGLRDNTTAQEEGVRKAKRALDEAEEKGRAVKRWTRDFEHETTPLTKRLDGLRGAVDFELPKAVAWLAQARRTLDAYSEAFAPAAVAGTAETATAPPDSPTP